MFKDTDEALARLEAELLREEEDDLSEEEYNEYEEEYDEEPEEEKTVPPEYVCEDTRSSASSVIYQNYSNNYGKNLRNYASGYHAYNADISDEDPDSYTEELLEEEEPEKSNTALVLIACLLSLTIAATVLIFALKARGVLW